MLTDDEIAKALAQANEIATWAKDVWKYSEAEAIVGRKKWSGFKVVKCRSNRKYDDEAKMAET